MYLYYMFVYLNKRIERTLEMTSAKSAIDKMFCLLLGSTEGVRYVASLKPA